MKKTKFSKILVFLLVVCIASSMLLLTACGDDGSHNFLPNKTDKDVQLVKNGDFTFASGNDYPRTPTNWTGNIDSSLKKDGLNSVKHGVINVKDSEYNYSNKNWNNLKNPGTHANPADSNMLMIYGSKPTSFSYMCDSFEIEANEYYKLSFWVKTVNISGKKDTNGEEGKSGAYIKVSGSSFNAEWIDVNTNEEWKQFEVYIEGGSSSANSLRVNFGLGAGDTSDGHLTQGYAFLDDVVLEKLDNKDGKGKLAYEQAVAGSQYQSKDSFRVFNTNFVNYNKLYPGSLPYSPIGWSFDYGGEGNDSANNFVESKDDKQPSAKKGLINLGNLDVNNRFNYGFNESFDPSTLKARTNSNDNFAMILYADKDYAINYTTNNKIIIEKGTIYRISVWVKALDTVTGEKAKGTVILFNDNEDYRISFDSDKYYVPGDSTGKQLITDANGWAEIVFNVRGNNTHDIAFNLSLALGTDGLSKKDTNWSCGHVLYDDITINSYPVTLKDAATTSKDKWAKNTTNTCHYELDLNKFNDEGTIKEDIVNGNLAGNVVTDANGFNLPEHFEAVKNDKVKFNVADGSTIKVEANEDLPFEVIYKFGDDAKSANKTLNIHSDKNSTVSIKYTDKLTAIMNTHYRLAFWVKTKDMPKLAGMNFNLNVLDDKGKTIKTESINDINSVKLSEKESKQNNGWQEVVFYISGDSFKNTDYSIEMSYGRGDNFSTTLARGDAYIYNINLQVIDLSAYNNASTGNNAKKVDLTTTTTSDSITNGSFNKVNNSTSSFDKVTGKLDKFGTTQSWSMSAPSNVKRPVATDKSELIKETDAVKGTVALTDGQLNKILNNENITDVTISDTVLGKLTENDNKFALGIYSNKDMILNYTSNDISLEANSFYSIRVKVFTAGGSASIKLTSSSPHEEGVDKFIINDATIQTSIDDSKAKEGWSEYTFFIQTGLSSASVSLVLSLGDLDSYREANPNIKDDKVQPVKTGLSKGFVMFDDARLIKHTTKDSYEFIRDLNNGSNKQTELIFNTDGFATSSYEKDNINTPNGWNKKAIDSAPDIKGESATVAGVIDLYRRNYEKIWDYTNKGVSDKNNKDYIDYINSKKTLIEKVASKEANYQEDFGSSVLMIDNLIETGYSVSTSSSKKLDKNSYYKISIWLYIDLDKDTPEDLGLSLTLKISNRDQDVVRFDNLKSTEGWQQFTFYVKNATVDGKDTNLDASLTMQLGTREKVNDKDELKGIKGTVFADNFKIEKMIEAEGKTPEAQFKEIENAIKDNTLTQAKTITYIPDKDIDNGKDEDKKPNEKAPVDWTMLSWAIPTIVLAVMLIAVLGVFIYKKYVGPKKHTKFKGSKKVKTKREEVTKNDDFDKFND